MKRPIAVVFDIGNVLYDWDPRVLYRRLIDDDGALDVFLRDVCSREWHFQHDAGRPFAETSAELCARFPDQAHLIAQWGPRFSEQIPGPIEGMPELVAELDSAGVPLFAITNFSDEFFTPFREQEAAMFGHFRDIVLSGAEKLVKPDAAIYRLALERFALAPHEALFVDDRQDNVDGAKAVGMHAVPFTDVVTLREDLERFGLLE
ncbi:Alpha-D-glucose-1-phosphate phosphatase YihX [Sphingomonas jeddahensis]|uniref:Alpha-D-glucose-1-phosphate phosphatase YihX n=1 Tax=Sphingomonas jeddahensis TaxID=1915074 RepID=A0A1V2EVQ0_9SPHN|nr:HAD family phosphatase [Sphingomonas jeddahensis]ONF96623.1 Alpha-D-glucose-1-phosphate phosphatase YihX [Sphingomonas jeddahensis]